MVMIKNYYMLTKPGIIFGNVITTAGGFALASRGLIDYWLFLAIVVGLFFFIASACVFNNYIDRDSDKMMARTKNRALVKGLISGRHAIIFAIGSGLVGVLILALFTNLLTVLIALSGFFIYVVLYSFLKYRSTYATLVGSISGGMPPVIGYCAVSNHFDLAALILFMMIVFWQMPHFYAIAIYRLHDYKAASIPVLPVKKGMFVTKIHMLIYIVAFIITSFLLTLYGFTGNAYLVIETLLGCIWLFLCIKGFKSSNDQLWARKMFQFSLLVVTLLCLMIAVDVR